MSVVPTTTKYGQRFLGNKNPSSKEVHDLKNEKTQCQIDEILRARNAVKFIPDTLSEAHGNGFDNCHWCLGGSTR